MAGALGMSAAEILLQQITGRLKKNGDQAATGVLWNAVNAVCIVVKLIKYVRWVSPNVNVVYAPSAIQAVFNFLTRTSFTARPA